MKAAYYEVVCDEHGKYLSDSDSKMKIKRVKTGTPKHKRDARGGCPLCRRTKK